MIIYKLNIHAFPICFQRLLFKVDSERKFRDSETFNPSSERILPIVCTGLFFNLKSTS